MHALLRFAEKVIEKLKEILIRCVRMFGTLVIKVKLFDKMIKYLEILSNPFYHCRVDLYNINGEITFVELTFYHSDSTEKLTFKKHKRIMGDLIDRKSEKMF